MKSGKIIPVVVMASMVIFLGMKFYAQHRHIDLYVSRNAPMPAELAAGLHMKQHRIEPEITIESPYADAKDKILSMDEIRRIRSQIVWKHRSPTFIDSLTIQSPTRVLARRTTSRVMIEYQLVRHDDHWMVESEQSSEIARGPVAAN